MKLWQKGEPLNRQIERFTVGDDFVLDQKLVKYDCQASIAHAEMLGELGILSTEEVSQLTAELNRVVELDVRGTFKIAAEQEDCHTAIENHLTEKLGELGKKIHTARSRNDQVLTALRLYYKEQLAGCRGLVDELVNSISDFVKEFGDIEWPGYTHMRKAMPSTIRLWAEALAESMTDNRTLLSACQKLVDQSPLGTAAGYGVPMAINRTFTAERLGFAKVQKNPIYCQASRGKFETTILHTLSQILFDLNKFATDVILFSMPEFGYLELPKEFCTGSSIMPQKKNPDVLELLRAKYHLIVGYEMQVKNLTANLMSGYNRDVQLTKEPTMKGLETAQHCLSIANLLLQNLKVNAAACQKALTDELFATEEVYKLVQQGMSFREAYQKVARKYS